MSPPPFRNLDELPHHRNLGGILRWKLGLYPKEKAVAKSQGATRVPWLENDGKALQGATRDGLTWLGHASWLVQLGGLSILTDPVFSERIVTVRRQLPPGLSYSALPKIDVVTVSHNHLDHMDASTLKKLGPEPLYLVPQGLRAWFTQRGFPRVQELAWWETTRVGALGVTFVPAQHWSRRGLLDGDRSLWGGFVFEHDGLRVYHSGDTAFFSGFAEIRARCGKPHAALLPIGAYEPRWFMAAQHMNPDDAVRAYTELQAEHFFAMHWGTFRLTEEALSEPPQVLDALWTQTHRDPSLAHVLASGETHWLR